MHDYMICIDESGSPYLAHALFGNRKGGQKKDHKWYARENVKGSWRYWYDPESYRKWQIGSKKNAPENIFSRTKKKVQSTVDDIKNASNAYKRYKQAEKDFINDGGYKKFRKEQHKFRKDFKKTATGRAIKDAELTIVYNAERTMRQVEKFLNSFDEPSEIRSAKKTVKSAKKDFDTQMMKVFGKNYSKFQKATKKKIRELDKFLYSIS